MTEFTDGPAAGEKLQLRRAPLFLRVVIDPRGTVDALDQPNDTPEAKECVFVYFCEEITGRYHLCVRGKGRGASGWYTSGRYRLYAEQPADDVLREGKKWAEWVDSRPEVLAILAQGKQADGE